MGRTWLMFKPWDRGASARHTFRAGLVLIVALVALVGLGGCGGAPAPSEADRELYEAVSRAQCDFIVSCQTPDGALLDVPDDRSPAAINTYEANIAVAGLVEGTTRQKDLICARHYLQWYGSQMLAGKNLGLPQGVVPDFDILLDGDYVKTYTPTAPAAWDINVASYLSALDGYAENGSADDFVASRYDDARHALDALLALQQENGLTRASDGDPTSYLVNNVEVLAGLYDAVDLYDRSWIPAAADDAEREGLTGEREELLEAAGRCREGILAELWDEGQGVWYVGRKADGTPVPFEGWDQFYPSAVAQLYPIAFTDAEMAERAGATAEEAEALLRDSDGLYQTFCDTYQWQDLAPDTMVDGHYWPSIAWVAARKGDLDRVRGFLERYREVMGTDDYHGDHSLGEAGWTARTTGYLLEQTPEG